MTDKQAYLLKLLKEFDQICRENDIVYSLAGGSLLGAVRHGGFIPWDDDVDIFVTLDNFKKLKAYFEEHDIENRAFIHRWNNDRYPMLIARYYATDNTSIQRATGWGYMPAGQYIDVMLMIPVPAQPEQAVYLKNMALYIELANEFYADNKFRDKAFMRSYRFWDFVGSIFGRKKVLDHLEKKFMNYPESEAEYFMLSHNLEANLIYERRLIDKVMYVKFEDGEFPVPCNYMDIFWRGYGSTWRNLPPKEARAQHKLFDDFDRPYNVYEEDYMRFVELPKVFSTAKKYKQMSLEDGIARREIYEELTRYRCGIYGLELKEDMASSGIDTMKELAEQNYAVLYDIYKPYIEKQLSSDIRARGGFIDIGDDDIYAACCVLIYYLGEYSSARKIIKIYEKNRTSPDPRIGELSELIERIEALYHAIDYGETEAVREMTEREEDAPQADFCLAGLSLISSEESDAGGAPELLQKAESMASLFPEVADFNWYVGLARERLGMEKEAREAFEDVVERSNNGIMIRDAKEKISDYED